MLRESGTILVFNAELGTFYNEPSETLLEDLRDYTPWPRKRCYRALAAEEVELPASLEEFPGWTSGSKAHLQPRYGYTEEWLNHVRRRAAIDGRAMEPMTIAETLKLAAKSATPAPEGSTSAARGSSTSTEFDPSRTPSTHIPVSVSAPMEPAPITSKLSSPSASCGTATFVSSNSYSTDSNRVVFCIVLWLRDHKCRGSWNARDANDSATTAESHEGLHHNLKSRRLERFRNPQQVLLLAALWSAVFSMCRCELHFSSSRIRRRTVWWSTRIVCSITADISDMD